MNSKRDELAAQLYNDNQVVLANQFKIGWDCCENENVMVKMQRERLDQLCLDKEKLRLALKRLQDECRQACHYDLLEIIDEALRKDG